MYNLPRIIHVKNFTIFGIAFAQRSFHFEIHNKLLGLI